MTGRFTAGSVLTVFVAIGLIIATSFITTLIFLPLLSPSHRVSPGPEESDFIYSFNAPGTLEEVARADKSPSPYWFLDSGGKLLIEGGVGKTVQGALTSSDRWRLAYAATNPVDTDNGYHPQNIFRLLTKNSWDDASMEASFMIAGDNFSDSPNRNASNGLFLMSRYQDQNTLYYAGVRVDGVAIIKKKYHGTYYTMAQKAVFAGTYGPRTPNLIPHDEWVGLRGITETNADGSVSVRLFMKRTDTPWVSVVSATDSGTFGGTPPILAAGPDGIRTDFMDVLFGRIRISPL